MDRVDIRVPLEPVPAGQLSSGGGGECSSAISRRVAAAVEQQRRRYRGLYFSRNAHILPGYIDRFCSLDSSCRFLLSDAVRKLNLSSRAFHSILRVARTIADLEQHEGIGKEHLLEAIQYRRYCEGDVYWSYS